MEYRIEHDSLGEVRVPADHMWGAQTQRSFENFKIGHVMPKEIIRAFAILKKCAAKVNEERGALAAEKGEAIRSACDEILAGKWEGEFPLVVYQTGSGTQSNMNMNEVVAHIANRKLEKAGSTLRVHPNDDVNMAQSTNDVYPTAGHMTLINRTSDLLAAVAKTAASFLKLADKHRYTIKMGRTQLEDAVPTTFGKEFGAYYHLLMRDYRRIEQAANALLTVPLGGTAIGTSICATPEYCALVVKELRHLSGMPLIQADDLSDAVQNTDSYVNLSAAYKTLACDLIKITNDLRLLGSGPQAGLHELDLPKVQAGSSIMPGKVNPVIPEVVAQVSFQVIGHDAAISLASASGQLELNAFEPVMFDDLFNGALMMTEALATLRVNCLEGLKVNEERCQQMAAHSAGLATALAPYIGYQKAAVLAKEAVATGKTIEKLLSGQISADILQDILKPEKLINPGAYDKAQKVNLR